MPPKGLTREHIVTEALALLDEVGLDGLNMRALATRLEVKAPALYWHFSNKQDLVDEMATALWRQVQSAGEVASGADWHDGMVAFALGLRRTLLAHRDGARLFSGTYLTDVSILEAQEAPLASLVGAGVPLETAVEISSVLYSYTVGATIEEQSVAQTPDDRYDLEQRELRLDPEKFPLVVAAGRLTFGDPGARFERIIRRLVSSFDGWDARG
jgi:TetR/AcrR family tetracycline transcriptional repressor